MSDKATTIDHSFPPLLGSSPNTLILGSMPSVKSLEQHQYYAHPRNAFWPIMAKLLDFDITLPYEQRCLLLGQHSIAVWDVLKACRREGSLDQNIDPDTMVINDFNAFLKTQPTINRLLFNGATAETLFKQALPHLDSLYLNLPMLRLPSTSPAHASMNFEKKLSIWRNALFA